MTELPSLDQIPFDTLKKNAAVAHEFSEQMWLYLEEIGWTDWFIAAIMAQSRVETLDANGESEWSAKDDPSQGLIITGYEETYRDGLVPYDLAVQEAAVFKRTALAWIYYLFLLNHPERIAVLQKAAEEPFQAPPEQFHPRFSEARSKNDKLTIEDIALEAGGEDKPRISRTKTFLNSLQVSYWREDDSGEYVEVKGRKQARSIFVVGENPDVVGSASLIASMAATHHLVGVPRDGVFKNIDRQAALAERTMEWLEQMPTLLGKSEDERAELLDWYKHNVVGTLESVPEKACERAEALYAKGVRTFRVYSPEPNSLLVETVQALRTLEAEKGWDQIEVFAGQVVSIAQAQQLEAAGADAIYVGIGGGGRCTTAKLGKLSINWPQLVWDLRGKIRIPIVVQGGASDNVPTSIATGASGIGVVGKVGGTIETPGGTQFWYDPENGYIFNFYGGEASQRMKRMGGKSGPFGVIPYAEGETTEKPLRGNHRGDVIPTSLQAIAMLMDEAVAGFIFQNEETIMGMQTVASQRLGGASLWDPSLSDTH